MTDPSTLETAAESPRAPRATARRRPWRLALLAAFLVAPAIAACDDPEVSPNNQSPPILDGFNGTGNPSACAGQIPTDGAACSVPSGAYCPLQVTCACFPTTRIISCECSNGAWICPQNCGGETEPCPENEPDMTMADMDVAGDATGDATTMADATGGDTTEPVDTATTAMDTAMDIGVDMAMGPTGSLTFSGGTTSDLSTIVNVPSATLDAAGWLVVSVGGTRIGEASLGAGTATNTAVELREPLTDGAMVTVALHTDAGAAGVFEPGADVVIDDGGPVQSTGSVDVPAGTPAVRLTASGTTEWTIAAEPSTIASAGAGANPTLSLRSGWRYEIVNTSSLSLELVDGADMVLLAEAGAGTLEADGAVFWTSAAGISQFTVAPALGGVVTGYRDAATTTIAGAITVN